MAVEPRAWLQGSNGGSLTRGCKGGVVVASRMAVGERRENDGGEATPPGVVRRIGRAPLEGRAADPSAPPPASTAPLADGGRVPQPRSTPQIDAQRGEMPDGGRIPQPGDAEDWWLWLLAAIVAGLSVGAVAGTAAGLLVFR